MAAHINPVLNLIQRAVEKKKKPDYNWHIAKLYAALLSGLIGVFIFIHWARIVYKKWRPQPGSVFATILSPFVSMSRQVRKILVRSVPVFASGGYALTVAAYIGISLVLSLVHLDFSSSKEWAERFGWMTGANIVLIVFLSMRNTPLKLLAGYSYERLQILHRIAGYASVLFMVLHVATYVPYYVQSGKSKTLYSKNIVMGILAGSSMFVTFVLAITIRRTRLYELFYATHVILFFITIIGAGLHRPFWRTKLPTAMLAATGIWGLDILIRNGRRIYNSVNNTATLEAFPHGGTRITIKKPLLGAKPGNHCFVWIPRIKALQTHPFTIVSNGSEGLELVANSYGGFTKALHDYAQSRAGARTFWASVDGPYGTFPNLSNFDRVILVAGGSGATFTFGLALHLVESAQSDFHQQVDFIWAVRKNERISWFEPHINTLRTHDAYIDMTVHVTDDTPLGLFSDSERSLFEKDSPAVVAESSVVEKSSSGDEQNKRSPASSIANKGVNLHSNRSMPYGVKNIKYEKLQVAESIQSIVSSVDKNQRVLIAACGPAEMMKEVRKASAKCISVDGPSIELHYESFSW